MGNLEKYISAFKETFNIPDVDPSGLKYQGIQAWDSVGHMALMAALEERFGIELEIDDIIEFSSFEVGQAILEKYKVSMK